MAGPNAEPHHRGGECQGAGTNWIIIREKRRVVPRHDDDGHARCDSASTPWGHCDSYTMESMAGGITVIIIVIGSWQATRTTPDDDGCPIQNVFMAIATRLKRDFQCFDSLRRSALQFDNKLEKGNAFMTTATRLKWGFIWFEKSSEKSASIYKPTTRALPNNSDFLYL